MKMGVSIGIIALVLCIFIFVGVKANQMYTGIVPLSVGDHLPQNLVLNKAYNVPAGKIKLKDFEGKLLIVDFWSTWCSSCIEGFSKMHELQNTFNDRIQIVLVNTSQSDTEQKVNSFFERRQQRTGTTVTLPYVLQDSVLVKYFPHNSIPHYAWISPQGEVLAITSAQEVTARNIQMILDGGQVKLRTKKDQLDFTNDLPLFINGNGGDPVQPLYRSMITGYIEGIGGNTGIRRDASNAVIGYYSLNKPLLTLLKDAYRHIMIYPDNRVIIESDNKILQQLKSKDVPEYCYELVMPGETVERAIATMRDDLSKAFYINVCNDKRRIKTWVLTAAPGLKNSYTKGGKEDAAFEKDREHKYLRNYSLKNMLWLANNSFSFPVVDETGITQNIDMDLPNDMYDESQWKKALEKAGFKVTMTEREMEVTIIQENK
ncbi:MAG: TlpA family protein disulfide reductase [Agriterribacter sp.]